MADRYDVMAKVISQRGTCAAEHKVGEEFRIGRKTPAGICLGAFNAVFPYVRALQFGATLPWSSDPDACTLACPDAENPVVFELRRVPEA